MGFLRDLLYGPDTESAAYRDKVNLRAVSSVPWVPFNVGSDLYSSSAMSVQQALSLSPVYAAVRIIAQDVSTLPIKGYRRVGDDRRRLPSLPVLFQSRLDDGSLTPWLFRCVTSLALRGNAYGLVTSRDGFGFPSNLEWLNPAEVSNDGVMGRTGWFWRGRPIPFGDLVHIPWFVLPGQVEGLSPIAAFASTIGVGLKAQCYQQDWFASGGVPPGTFRNTQVPIVDPDDAAKIKSRLVSAIKTREPIVFGSDWEYTPISVPAGDAQFVESMRLTANQIAPIYGVRPEKIGGDAGGSLTYATVEQNQLEYTTSTLRFWLELLEGAFYALLPKREFVKFNVDALIRSDTRSRWEVYRIARLIGVKNVDEIRALEDLPPLPNGEGQDYTPLGPAAEGEGPGSDPSMNGQTPPSAVNGKSPNGKVPTRRLMEAKS